MLSRESLRDLLVQKGLSQTDKILLCLAAENLQAKSIGEVREAARSAGLRAAGKWNLSNLLGRSNGFAVRGTSGWELTAKGIEHVTTLAGPLMTSPVLHVATSLRGGLAKIANKNTASFVEEAVASLEAGHYRSAIVLSWVGAVAVLYDFIINTQLPAFNAEASSRSVNSKHPWRSAKTADDLARMKESEFLEILEKLSIIGKSVKAQLVNCLNLRNGCGHPNSLAVSANMASSHVETLILNVFLRF